MKTTQVLAAAAALFPLVALATDHADMPHASSAASVHTGTFITTQSEVPTATPTPEYELSFNELGCYKDTLKKGNPINADGTGKAAALTFNTVGSCARNSCGSYKYAAVMAGNMCYCSQTLPELVKADEKECNMACTGYNIDMCGGKEAFHLLENKELATGGGHSVQATTGEYPTASRNSSSVSHEPTGSATTTKGPASTSTNPVTAGASALVGQSWAFLAGVGALFFL